jgi:hypothetical protein
MNQLASNSNIERTLAGKNCLHTDPTMNQIIPFNSETSMRVSSILTTIDQVQEV